MCSAQIFSRTRAGSPAQKYPFGFALRSVDAQVREKQAERGYDFGAREGPMTPRVVTPSEHGAFFNEAIRRLQSTHVCFLALDEQNRSVAKATAVFVRVGPQKMLVTARHVVRSEK